MMTEHHRGGMETAEGQLADGVHTGARDLARRIIGDQARETSETENLLRDL